MLTGNFILYLAVQFVMQFIPNIIVSVKVDKEFPYLKECRELPEKEEFHGILRNIGAMSFHKLGTVIVRNTDSLLLVQKFGVAGIQSAQGPCHGCSEKDGKLNGPAGQPRPAHPAEERRSERGPYAERQL